MTIQFDVMQSNVSMTAEQSEPLTCRRVEMLHVALAQKLSCGSTRGRPPKRYLGVTLLEDPESTNQIDDEVMELGAWRTKLGNL
jgi:hypothetical protein